MCGSQSNEAPLIECGKAGRLRGVLPFPSPRDFSPQGGTCCLDTIKVAKPWQVGSKKVGKIEQEIQNLYDMLDKMEKENSELRGLVKQLLAARK